MCIIGSNGLFWGVTDQYLIDKSTTAVTTTVSVPLHGHRFLEKNTSETLNPVFVMDAFEASPYMIGRILRVFKRKM